MPERASNLLVEDEALPNGQPGGSISAQEEADLVKLCQEGQAFAFTALVRLYQDRIYNVIVRMGAGVEDAEELAQETFLKAFEKLDNFRGKSRFYTWLFRIATNLAISHRRRGMKIKFHPLQTSDDAGGQDIADARTADISARRTQSPDEAMMANERAEQVAEALDTLDDEFRVVIVLRDMEDLDYREIGEVLGLRPGTVKSRLHRARNMLREKLAKLVNDN